MYGYMYTNKVDTNYFNNTIYIYIRFNYYIYKCNTYYYYYYYNYVLSGSSLVL